MNEKDPLVSKNPINVETQRSAKLPLDATPGEPDDGKERGKKAVKGKVKKAVGFLSPRIHYYIPFFEWVFSYQISYLFGDIMSGLSVGTMLVPQSLAFTSLIRIPPIYGLYTALIPSIVYSVFCNSKQLAFGPEAMISMLVGINCVEILTLSGQVVTEENILALVAMLSFLVGLFTFLFGIFRVGFLDNILSRPILRGFITAVSFSILLEQIDTFCGFNLPNEHGLAKIIYIFDHRDEVHIITLVIGICSLLTLTMFHALKQKTAHIRSLKVITFIPEILLVVVGGIAVTKACGLIDQGVQVLGTIEGSYPKFKFPYGNFNMIKELYSVALVITIVGFVESTIIAKHYAGKHNYTVSANRELVALGLANITASFFGGWPSFGSMPRSVINDRAGAKTPLAGIVSAGVVALTLGLLHHSVPLFTFLPRVVLAAIIMSAAFALFETQEIFFLFKIRAWKDLLLLFTTTTTSIVFGLEVGLFFSIVISVFLIIRHSTMPTVVIRGRIPGTDRFHDLKVFRDINLFDKKHEWFQKKSHVSNRGVLVARIEDSLYFANMGHIKALFQKIEQTSEIPLSGIILDVKNVYKFDATAVEILSEMISEYKSRNIPVCVVKLKGYNQRIFWRAGLMEQIGTDHIFAKTSDAVACLEGRLNDYSSYQITPI